MPPPGWHGALCLPSLHLPNVTVPTNHASRHTSFPPLPTGHLPQIENVKFFHDIPTKPGQGGSKMLFHIIEFMHFLFANTLGGV
jgi:hypothetical protein